MGPPLTHGLRRTWGSARALLTPVKIANRKILLYQVLNACVYFSVIRRAFDEDISCTVTPSGSGGGRTDTIDEDAIYSPFYPLDRDG